MMLDKKILLSTIDKCLLNSRELYEEAEILKKHEKYARSYTLYHLSIEEIGKVFIIYKFLLNDDYSEGKIKKFDKEFKEHKIKIDFSTNINLIIHWLFKGNLALEAFKNLKYTNEQINDLNNFKNISLYTFIDNENVFKPSDIINSEEQIESIKLDAKIRLLGTEQFCSVALENLDKMIEIIKLENEKSKNKV
jgi:AbiV family abortive infection protein